MAEFVVDEKMTILEPSILIESDLDAFRFLRLNGEPRDRSAFRHS